MPDLGALTAPARSPVGPVGITRLRMGGKGAASSATVSSSASVCRASGTINPSGNDGARRRRGPMIMDRLTRQAR
jgi:hypothetical protein